MRYVIEQKLSLTRSRFCVRDGSGRDLYLAEGRAIPVLEQFVLKELSGRELALVKRSGVLKESFDIYVEGVLAGKVTPKRKLLRMNYRIETPNGKEISATGNFSGYEYLLQSDGRTVAQIHKKLKAVRDEYALDVSPGEDELLMIATVLAIDAIQDALRQRQKQVRSQQQDQQRREMQRRMSGF